jgi:hypothetical protein
MSTSFVLPRRSRHILAAGAAAFALMSLGMSSQARAGSESAQPYCWGPSNSPADCPDYSLMNPYAYGKYYYRIPTPQGYDGRYERDDNPNSSDPAEGSPHNR